MKKRYDKVIKGSENYIHVEEFVLALTSPVERGTKGENAALRRLLQGFSDEEKNWACPSLYIHGAYTYTYTALCPGSSRRFV